MVKHLQPRGFLPVSTDDPPKTKRSPRGSRLTEACPECDAPIGQRCVSPDGTKTSNIHASRTRLVNRKRNAQQSEAS